MAVNERNLQFSEKKLFKINHLLGILGLIGAPMLLVFINYFGAEPGKQSSKLASFLGVLYIGGWMASAVGMRQLRITGDRSGSKIVFIVQIILLSLAFAFSVMETCGINSENGGVIFAVTDAAYPLSHLFMLVVGSFVWRAGKWRGIFALAPFMVGLALPLFLGLMPVFGQTIGGFGFGIFTAVGHSVLACGVFTEKMSNPS